MRKRLKEFGIISTITSLELSRRYWNELSFLSVNANVFDHEQIGE